MNLSRLKSMPVLLTATLLLMAGCSTPLPNATEETGSPTGATSSAPDATATSPASTSVTTASPNPNVPSDMVVIPGERFGPITPNMTRQDLAQLFGEERLKDEDMPVGEGFSEPGTRINLGADESFSVVWTDTTRTKLTAIRDIGSAWKTPEGIGTGTSLATLQEKIGDFRLYGFGWDYGGTVQLDTTSLKQYDGLLVLRMQPEPGAAEQYAEDYAAVIGETLYLSNDPHLQALKPTVNEMIVYLTPPSE